MSLCSLFIRGLALLAGLAGALVCAEDLSNPTATRTTTRDSAMEWKDDRPDAQAMLTQLA